MTRRADCPGPTATFEGGRGPESGVLPDLRRENAAKSKRDRWHLADGRNGRGTPGNRRPAGYRHAAPFVDDTFRLRPGPELTQVPGLPSSIKPFSFGLHQMRG